MKLNADDIVCLATVRSTRIMFIVATTMLFLKLEREVFSKDWTVAGQNIPVDLVLQYGTVILVFLSVGHLLHWSGDYASYRLWFNQNDLSLKNFDSLLEQNPLKALLKQVEQTSGISETIAQRLSNIEKINGEMESIPAQDDLNKLLGEFKALCDQYTNRFLIEADIFEMLPSRFTKLSWSAWFHLWGWYLVVPIGLALLAIFYPIGGHSQ